MQMIREQKDDSGFVRPTFGKHIVASSTVFNEDCMNLMSRYSDKHFDLAVVDPPYGIGVNVSMGRRKRYVHEIIKKRASWST